jgi:hypothetical protein
MSRISVLLHVYNAAPYLEESIDSLLQQSFRDFEIIAVDDGSTDESLAILQAAAQRDARIHLISRSNRGLVRTLNEALDLSQGQWVARMDADDICTPDRFQKQLDWLAQSNADACGSWMQIFGGNPQRVIRHPVSDEGIKTGLLFGCPLAHPSMMMRGDRLRALRYDPEWEKAEDYDLWIRAAQAGWKLGNVPEVLLYYRTHGQQQSHQSNNKQQALTQRLRQRYWHDMAPTLGVSPSSVDEVLKLRESHPRPVDMDQVDAALVRLLTRTQGEAQTVALDHSFRLYCRAASSCPDIVARWVHLNRTCGLAAKWASKIKLGMLRLFRLQPDHRLFEVLKRLNAQ